MEHSEQETHISEAPATAALCVAKVAFTEHAREWLGHSAAVLGFDPFAVVKALVMQGPDAKPHAEDSDDGSRPGYLVGIDPQVCVRLLGAR